MSKVGQKPITIPSGVQVEANKQTVTVKGTKGQLVFDLPRELSAKLENDTMELTRTNDSKHQKTIHGLYRNLIANAVQGVSIGWTKRLAIVGTGFNVKMQGQSLVMKLGFSHPVIVNPVDGIQFSIEGNNIIIISGHDKQMVGQVAHQVKIVRKPDAYKGKGIRYEGEYIKLKAGKKAKTA